MKNVSMWAAFPLGAGAQGGWRLGLSQRINEHLSMDAKLRGARSVAVSTQGQEHCQRCEILLKVALPSRAD